MISTTTFLIGFGLVNLLLAIFHKRLAGLVVGFFKFNRRLSPPERTGEQAKAPGFDRAFIDRATSPPTMEQAARFLLWTGAINALGCVAFYFFLPAMGGPAADTASSAGPGNTRTERRVTREEEAPDPRVALRKSFDDATASSDPATKEKAMEQIAWDGIDVDPALAREAFAALEPGGPAAKRLVGHFAMRLADTDPDQALEWARGLEQEEERTEAFGRIAVVVSAEDPERGAKLISEEMPSGLPRDRAVVQVLQRWSQSAPAEAVEWIAAFPQGAARSAGLKAVAATWIESDPSSLATWVEAREDGPVRNEAVLAVAETLRPATAEVRAARLASFRDPEVRRKIEDLLAQTP